MISKKDSEPGELDATKPAPERKKERRHVACILTPAEIDAALDALGLDRSEVFKTEGGQS